MPGLYRTTLNAFRQIASMEKYHTPEYFAAVLGGRLRNPDSRERPARRLIGALLA